MSLFKRRTTKLRRRPQQVEVLQARLMSPRMVWLTLRSWCARGLKFGLVAGLTGGAGWWTWQLVEQRVLKHEEFRLQMIDLNENEALDVATLMKVAEIGGDETLFELDVSGMEQELKARPEVRSAKVKRVFPGTLKVELEVRRPVAWVAVGSTEGRDAVNGLLVDGEGWLYRCPAKQWSEAEGLPVIEVAESAAPAAGQRLEDEFFPKGLKLYGAIQRESASLAEQLDRIRWSKRWAMEAIFRDGMVAEFGLGDHVRQVRDLLAARKHAESQGESIERISLIPQRHLPVSYREGIAPRAILVEEEEPSVPGTEGRREQDLDRLIRSR